MSRSLLHEWESDIERICGDKADEMLEIAKNIYDTGFARGKNKGTNKGEWIPITEGMELPEHDVICCDNEGNIALGYLYFDEEENQIACDRDPYVMFGVVAYMELPEPYKAESEDKE